jgi:peptidoglycan/LPS O-acetylase OafA/YrhL
LSFAIFSYSFFLPNLVNNIFQVGGALYVAWSIGAQEQFYWMLIPAMKKKLHLLPLLLIFAMIVFVAMNIANAYNAFGLSPGMQAFVHSLRFHYMAIGSLLGYYLYYKREKLLSLWIFSKPLVQVTIFAVLVSWYGFKTDSVFIKNTITLPMSLLYGWIVINVGANPKNVIKISNPVFEWIGKRTFGVYLIHMFVVYAISFLFTKTQLFLETFWLYQLTFYTLVFSITIFLAHLSFAYYEKFFMNLYDKLSNAQQNRPMPNNTETSIGLEQASSAHSRSVA